MYSFIYKMYIMHCTTIEVSYVTYLSVNNIFTILKASDSATLCYQRIWNWWKGKPSGSIASLACTRPWFYWSCWELLRIYVCDVMGGDVALYVVVWYDVTSCYGVSNKGEPGNHNAKYSLYSSTEAVHQ